MREVIRARGGWTGMSFFNFDRVCAMCTLISISLSLVVEDKAYENPRLIGTLLFSTSTSTSLSHYPLKTLPH